MKTTKLNVLGHIPMAALVRAIEKVEEKIRACDAYDQCTPAEFNVKFSDGEGGSIWWEEGWSIQGDSLFRPREEKPVGNYIRPGVVTISFDVSGNYSPLYNFLRRKNVQEKIAPEGIGAKLPPQLLFSVGKRFLPIYQLGFGSPEWGKMLYPDM